MGDDPKRMVPKPAWVLGFESMIASLVPLHPNVLSAFKLVVIFPLVAALKQVDGLPGRPWLVIGLFLLFAALDYLDGVVARQKDKATRFGRIFDRVTDYPILAVLSYFCVDILPLELLGAKLSIDFLLMVLFILGKGSTENRLRTAMSYATLLSLLLVSQGWAPRLATPELVGYLLITNVTFSSVVALYNLGALQKRFVADALSAANLLCGVFSMLFARKGRFDLSLLFLMLGAAFDGFDGAAARKWGGTRFGVYSDDIADGVNYGVAPGVALYFAVGGIEGVVLGAFYSMFTISRLVYFTLNKAYSDPAYFCGVPSTVGALVTLCSIILFPDNQVVLGFMVGIACMQMLSFDTLYKHMGRALASNRRIIYGMPVLVLALLAGHLFWKKEVTFMVILGVSLLYGFLPTFSHFISVIKRKKPTA